MIVACLVLLPATAQAEPTPLRWSAHRSLAEHLSDMLVYAQIGMDTAASWRSEDRNDAFRDQGCRLAVGFGATEGIKRLVSRTRPDGSDRKSFPSMHTAAAVVSSGWRLSVGIPIAIGTGYFRMAADKHYLTDVIVGAAVGALAVKVCR